jgi:hypothetical protein
MQWLEQIGLMTTHWADKLFEFEWHGGVCHLQGITVETKHCEPISVAELQCLHQNSSTQYLLHLSFTSDSASQTVVPHIVAMVLDNYE